MRIKEYSPDRPIILGDFGIEKEPKVFPKLTGEELLAMQAPSTQELMRMDPSEPYLIKDNWKAKDIEVERTDDGRLLIDGVDRTEAMMVAEKNRQSRPARLKRASQKTPLIYQYNINGSIPELNACPEWRKDMVTSKLKHNTEVQALKDTKESAPKELWKDMTWLQAMWHWIGGGEVKKEEQILSWRDK